MLAKASDYLFCSSEGAGKLAASLKGAVTFAPSGVAGLAA
jgi:hypothetical protein